MEKRNQLSNTQLTNLMQHSQEQLREKFKTLPKQVQRAIVSANTEERMLEISKKHNLHIDQTSELLAETGLVMFGLSPTSDYVKNLQRKLQISNDKATQISQDINEQVFKEIKSVLVEAEKIGEPTGEQTLLSPEEEGDTPPSRESILGEIEDDPEEPVELNGEPSPLSELAGEEIPKEPVELNTPPKDIMEEKLGGEFSVQSTEQEVGKKEVSAPEKKFDPYREAVE